ncbi:MAG: transposase family protein, partial [Chloroflexi bacterium]|nr:transposase family protein [Chloroflexota bacterium]
KPRRRQRGRTYGPELDDALRVIDESFDYICAERLTPNLVWMTQHLAQHGELKPSDQLLSHMERISVSTVRRILQRIRQDQARLPRRKAPPRPQYFQSIPAKRLPWDIATPGHFEVDLVHHCGPSASGEYVCTLQMVDVATGWSERIAVLGRSYRVIEHAFRVILRRLPFPVREVHPDNGSEFLNHHMLRLWGDSVQGVTFSRSRPYLKNDNRLVEQKNATLVRAYLGFDRLDSVAQTLAANRLLELMWVYYNLFQPVMHLVDKDIIREDGQLVRIRRRHDQPRTPFDRLCETQAILPQHREQLNALRDQVNPRALRQQIYDALEALFALPGATPDTTEDVHLTLLDHYSETPAHWPDLQFNRTPIHQSPDSV